ncbi:uncharacterized protein EMH_0041440 [Eimeria mitis]|uniref:Uncharacterized protein n=1 Tax=Eimeria mitis TaxID=44415 RepID=U6JUS1_9EIME|nr:uncharacterized protein EMH_0041440 [Eimeria mitis]CDJ28501.1 hypothetical protein EMH_0041440 [Eimeria mitis]
MNACTQIDISFPPVKKNTQQQQTRNAPQTTPRGDTEVAKADTSPEREHSQLIHTEGKASNSNNKNNNSSSTNTTKNNLNTCQSVPFATNETNAAPPPPLSLGAESAAEKGDEDEDEDREKNKTHQQRRLPKILFEPAPKRPQLSSSSSPAAAAETPKNENQGPDAETERRGGEEKADSDSVSSCARVFVRRGDEKVTASKDIKNASSREKISEKEETENSAKVKRRSKREEAVGGLEQGRSDEMQQILWGISAFNEAKTEPPNMNSQQRHGADTDKVEPAASVQSYDGCERRNTGSTQMSPYSQINRQPASCNYLWRGKAYANTQGDQGGNSSQRLGHRAQPWARQESGQQTYAALSTLKMMHGSGEPMVDPYETRESSCHPFYESYFPPPPPLSPRKPYAPPHPTSYRRSNAVRGASSSWGGGTIGHGTAHAFSARACGPSPPAVSLHWKTHREGQDFECSGTQLVYDSRPAVPSSPIHGSSVTAQADNAVSLVPRGTRSPPFQSECSDEQVEADKPKTLRSPDLMDWPRHEEEPVARGGALLAPDHAGALPGSGASGSTLKPPCRNKNEGSSVTSRERLLTTSPSSAPRSSKATNVHIAQDGSQFNRDTPISKPSDAVTDHNLTPAAKVDLQTEYKLYLKQRLEAVMRGVWSWRSESVEDFSEYHEKPFSATVAQNAIRNGFTPYILMHYASTTGVEESLKPLDMSVRGRRNIPFYGFSEELVDSLCSGIGHGMMYYSVIPGSVFPIHCEQGGLGAFNIIVGALMPYTEQLYP